MEDNNDIMVMAHAHSMAAGIISQRLKIGEMRVLSVPHGGYARRLRRELKELGGIAGMRFDVSDGTRALTADRNRKCCVLITRKT